MDTPQEVKPRGRVVRRFKTCQEALRAGVTPDDIHRIIVRDRLEMIPNGPFEGRLYKKNALGQKQRVHLSMMGPADE